MHAATDSTNRLLVASSLLKYRCIRSRRWKGLSHSTILRGATFWDQKAGKQTRDDERHIPFEIRAGQELGHRSFFGILNDSFSHLLQLGICKQAANGQPLDDQGKHDDRVGHVEKKIAMIRRGYPSLESAAAPAATLPAA